MIVKVVRSGGFAGLVASGELDTTTEPDGGQVEQAVRGLDRARLGTGRPQPDRYVYRVEVRDAPDAEPVELTVAEQDVDHDVAWLLDRVLKRE